MANGGNDFLRDQRLIVPGRSRLQFFRYVVGQPQSSKFRHRQPPRHGRLGSRHPFGLRVPATSQIGQRLPGQGTRLGDGDIRVPPDRHTARATANARLGNENLGACRRNADAKAWLQVIENDWSRPSTGSRSTSTSVNFCIIRVPRQIVPGDSYFINFAESKRIFLYITVVFSMVSKSQEPAQMWPGEPAKPCTPVQFRAWPPPTFRSDEGRRGNRAGRPVMTLRGSSTSANQPAFV